MKQGKTVRAMVRNEDERAHALREMGAEVVVGDLLEPADVYRVGSGIGGAHRHAGGNRKRSALAQSPGAAFTTGQDIIVDGG
ncbi:MAG: hypothetical protein WCA06_03260 [Terrimicrobiaceae bacterium]